MGLTVRDLMEVRMVTVDSSTPVTELERLLIEHRITGAPVVDDGVLVGVVSRSDVVRSIVVERGWAEQLADYYSGLPGTGERPLGSLGERIGARVEQMKVGDVMIKGVQTASPDQSAAEVAQQMLDNHVHRLPVVDDKNALVGVITTFDLIRMIAEQR